MLLLSFCTTATQFCHGFLASIHLQPLFFEGQINFFFFSTLLQSVMVINYGFIFYFAACPFCQHTAGSAPYYLILCTLHYFAGPPDLLPHSYALAAQDYKGESLLNRTVLPRASQITTSQSLFHSITVADHCCISLLQLLETKSKLFAWIESGPAFRLSSL